MGKDVAVTRMEILLNISLSEHSLLSVLAKSNGLLHISTTWKKAGQAVRAWVRIGLILQAVSSAQRLPDPSAASSKHSVKAVASSCVSRSRRTPGQSAGLASGSRGRGRNKHRCPRSICPMSGANYRQILIVRVD